jgi:hypothetical protein
VRSTPERDIG